MTQTVRAWRRRRPVELRRARALWGLSVLFTAGLVDVQLFDATNRRIIDLTISVASGSDRWAAIVP
jgi:hypothetical protein